MTPPPSSTSKSEFELPEHSTADKRRAGRLYLPDQGVPDGTN